jgi:hypothetical protein
MAYLDRIKYVSRDFDAIRSECIGSIQNYVPEWTDHNESDLGIVLIDHFAGIEDQVHFYIDKEVNECFIDTARELENVISLLKLINYTISNYVPSSTSIVFQLNGSTGWDNDIIIPEGTRVLCGDSNTQYIFNTTSDLLIEAGQLGNSVTAFEGEFFVETLATSNGVLVWQEYPLTYIDWLEDHLTVYSEDIYGIKTFFNRVSTFQFSDPTDPVYKVSISQFETRIQFGDNIHGMIPENNSQIKVEYFRGHGKKANVGANTLVQLLDPIKDVLGNDVGIYPNNPEAASGGSERETIDQAKVNGPASLTTMWRAVTLNDYDVLATAFRDPVYGTVTKAKSVLNNEYYTAIDVYVLGEDQNGYPAFINSSLKNALKNYLEERRTATVEVNIKDPILKAVNIDATVYVFPNYDLNYVKNSVLSILDVLFLTKNAAFGGGNGMISLSSLYALLNSAHKGISYALIQNPTGNIPINMFEFPTKGNINIAFEGVV